MKVSPVCVNGNDGGGGQAVAISGTLSVSSSWRVMPCLLQACKQTGAVAALYLRGGWKPERRIAAAANRQRQAEEGVRYGRRNQRALNNRKEAEQRHFRQMARTLAWLRAANSAMSRLCYVALAPSLLLKAASS